MASFRISHCGTHFDHALAFYEPLMHVLGIRQRMMGDPFPMGWLALGH